MDTTTLLVLLTGHLIGDFWAQPDCLAERKTRHSGWLVAHAGIVAVITGVLLGTLRAWPVVATLFLLHLGIDSVKRHFENNRRNDDDESGGPGWFALDQVLHLVSLVLLAVAVRFFASFLPAQNAWAMLWGSDYGEALILLSGFIATVWVLGFVLRFEMAGFASGLSPELKSGLPRAGRSIGRIERLLVFVFVLAGYPAAVGFVVAAKSVFRIGELNKGSDRDYAEYIMIGTLKSFAYALLLAFATRRLMNPVGG